MQIVVESKNDCADRVKLDCSPVEWLLINSALRIYSRLAHEKDKAKLKEMCDTKPLIERM